MAKANATQRDFAEKCGISPGFPPLLLSGKRTPPLEKLSLMAGALKLLPGSPERVTFERAAYLSHAPVEVREIVADLETKLTKCEQKAVRLLTTLTKIKKAAIGAGVQLPELVRDL